MKAPTVVYGFRPEKQSVAIKSRCILHTGDIGTLLQPKPQLRKTETKLVPRCFLPLAQLQQTQKPQQQQRAKTVPSHWHQGCKTDEVIHFKLADLSNPSYTRRVDPSGC